MNQELFDKFDNSKDAPCSLTSGQRNVQFGKYLWRVLDVKNGRALLLTEEILEQRRYHSKRGSVTWETCDLRKYLNGAFLQTFSSQEQERIVQTENRNADNPKYGTPGGRDTVDRVFLLSIEEVLKYSGDDSAKIIAKYQDREEWWWLRSPGSNDDYAAYVIGDGYLYMFGRMVISVLGGVRPALWLKL